MKSPWFGLYDRFGINNFRSAYEITIGGYNNQKCNIKRRVTGAEEVVIVDTPDILSCDNMRYTEQNTSIVS